jgi:hypothetical protein
MAASRSPDRIGIVEGLLSPLAHGVVAGFAN